MNATDETLLNLTRCRDSWPSKTGMQYSTWQMCIDMYGDIADEFKISLDAIKWWSSQDEATLLNGLEQRTSSALTYHLTCVHGLQEQGLWNSTGDLAGTCGIDTERMTELLSNGLSLLEHVTFSNETTQLASPPSRRRLLSTPVRPNPYIATMSRQDFLESESRSRSIRRIISPSSRNGSDQCL
jgi:hypothetical protein